MPVSELAIANSLFWLFGYDTFDERSRELADRLNLRQACDEAELRNALLASGEFRQSYAERVRLPRNRTLDLDRPRLVFLHVPKCGGTTLHTVLARHFDPGQICPERFNGLRGRRLEELASYTFFSGHFDLESCQALLGRDTRVVTMLREPRARLVSLYYFLTIHRPGTEPATASMISLARSMSAEAFFAHPLVRRHASIRNAMVSLFTQPHWGVRWEATESQLQDDDPVLTDPMGAVDKALDALESLSGFGLLERFAPSLALISASLGLPLTSEPAQQVTDDMRLRDTLDYAERPDLTPELIAILDELTEADRLFYARAEALFAQRLAALPQAASPTRSALALARPEAVAMDLFTPREGRRDGHRIVASGRAGVLAVGPYTALKHGQFRLTMHVAGLPSDREAPGPTIHIWHQRGRALITSAMWTGPGPIEVDFTLPFDVGDVEYIMEIGENSGLELLAVELSRATTPDRNRGPAACDVRAP